MSADEHERNERGKDVLLISDRHPLYDELSTTFYSKKQGPPKLKLKMRIGQLGGKAEKNDAFLPHGSLLPPLDDIRLPEDVDDDRSLR